MIDHSWAPNRRQAALIRAMATFPYPKLTIAARELEIPTGTARNWMLDPRFRMALNHALDEAKSTERADLERRLYGLADTAVAAIVAGLTCPDPAVQVRAAGLVLDRVLGKPKDGAAPASPAQTGQQIEIFQTSVLAVIGEVSPDVRDRIIEQLRRNRPALPAPVGADGRG